MELDFSRPGKPTDNAFIEATHRKFRQECLNENWFLSLSGPDEKVESWGNHYNGERPQHRARELDPEGVHRASRKRRLTRKTSPTASTGNWAKLCG